MLDLSGRPLADSEADRRLYVIRNEHALLRRSAEQGLNVLVVGPRGSGKTTLLRQVLLNLRERDHPCAFIDGKLAKDAFSFLQLVRFQLGEAPNLPQLVRERYARAFEPRPNLGEATALLDLIDSMRSSREDSAPTTLFVDGLPSSDVAHSLFGRLRDELWQLPFNWIVGADERERAALMEPPADAFIDRVVTLGPMGPAEQLALLEKRADMVDKKALHPLIKASDGNPRVLLALARDTVERGTGVEDLLAARARRQTAASNLGRPASMLLTELEEMGAASASDEELLRRMGWTRTRATQVFAELEQAGLVTAREERGTSGRPRKVYRPSPDVEL